MRAQGRKLVELLSEPVPWAVLCVAAAAALRLPALLRDDFWLDEIWALRLARAASGVWDILYAAPTSNNHILITLWLYAVRGTHLVGLFRLPPFVAGLAAVPAAIAVARRYGADEGRVAGALCALWFPLLAYSTEARGYAVAAAAALVCWAWRAQGRRAWTFGFVCAAGLLSQLIFVYVYVGLIAAECWSVRAPASERLKRHAIPALAFVAVCVPQALRLIVDGPSYRLGAVLAEAAGLLWATPATALGAAAAVGLSLAAAVPATENLRREGDLPFLALVLLVPLAGALSRPEVLFARYFLPAAACALPVFACGLVRLWRSGGVRRAAAVALAATFVALQSGATLRFWRYGRGGYRAAVETIASQEGLIRVASDHDFRNRMVLEYYAAPVPPGRIIYVPAPEAARAGADWFLAHRLNDDDAPPPRSFRGPRGAAFALARVFPHAGPSGWAWYLYRRD